MCKPRCFVEWFVEVMTSISACTSDHAFRTLGTHTQAPGLSSTWNVSIGEDSQCCLDTAFCVEERVARRQIVLLGRCLTCLVEPEAVLPQDRTKLGRMSSHKYALWRQALVHACCTCLSGIASEGCASGSVLTQPTQGRLDTQRVEVTSLLMQPLLSSTKGPRTCGFYSIRHHAYVIVLWPCFAI
jgi:hypothetical protein